VAEDLGFTRPQTVAVLDAVTLSTFYFVRHAKSGSREDWQGDDRLRPLTKKGRKQAEELVKILKPFPITAIYSSPFLRCVQTVEPLALAHGLKVRESEALSEGQGLKGASKFTGDPKLDQVVLGCHGDLTWELVEDLVKRKVIKAGEGGLEKGSTWVVDYKSGVPVKARYIGPPSP
jgi:8-oxo-dGTP diphosphatase